MGAVLVGQRTRDNIDDISHTKAIKQMALDLKMAGVRPNEVEMRQINDRYRMLGGEAEIKPLTLGAVQFALGKYLEEL